MTNQADGTEVIESNPFGMRATGGSVYDRGAIPDRWRAWTGPGSRTVRAGAVAAVALPLASLPWMLNAYWLRVATMVVMLALLAQAWNIITGYVGYPAFGNIAFFGLGAYGVGALTTVGGLGFLPALALASVGVGLVAVMLGPALLRARGHYFALSTIALALAMRETMPHIPVFSPLGSGTMVVPAISFGSWRVDNAAYTVMLVLLGTCVLATYVIDRGRFGYGLKAIREDEEAAALAGVPVRRHRVLAWAISAVFTGAAGGTWAAWNGAIDPASSFDLGLAVLFCAMALVGGLGTVTGPLVGALFVGVAGEFVWAEFPRIHILVMGLIVMAGVMFVPNGIISRVGFRSMRR